jgi:dTDP-4-dehydrorhamnose reductase
MVETTETFKMTLQIALLGGSSQLGQCLINIFNANHIEYIAPIRKECDITDKTSVSNFLSSQKFTHVINCAAWTDVDEAEKNQDSAFLINAEGPRYIAQTCSALSLKLLHISTDYVFEGNTSIPYKTTDATFPKTKYGQSKLAGENFILAIHPEQSWVVRTAWLYSPFGKNFAKTILRKAITGEPLSVINDAWGQPTSALHLAQKLLELLKSNCAPGIYHGTNSGSATWFEFAKELLELSGLDTDLSPAISKIISQKAPRPSHSVLDHSEWNRQGMSEMINWKIALNETFPEIFRAVQKEQRENHAVRD